MRAIRVLLGVPLLFLATGCLQSGGIIPMQNLSTTQLDGADFTIVRSNLRGEASCPYLFGLFPLADPAIATQAMNEVMASAKPTGKPMALANFAADVVVANYFGIVQVQSVFMRADAVEFNK